MTEFEKGAWEISIVGGRAPTATIKGYRFRDFAVHKKWTKGGCGRSWRVTHLPSGLCVPFDFPTLVAAQAAAVEIDRVRNTWVGLDPEEVLALRERVIPICRAHGGVSLAPNPVGRRTYERELATPRNGYAATP